MILLGIPSQSVSSSLVMAKNGQFSHSFHRTYLHRYGHAFTFDTANSCGEIIGHSKVANACHIRNNRPFRAVTCSDDMTVNFYQGPPYKFSKSINDHSRFVQSVRFSPDGQFFVSVGSDAKVRVFTFVPFSFHSTL
jgi:WD40 repeat protein